MKATEKMYSKVFTYLSDAEIGNNIATDGWQIKRKTGGSVIGLGIFLA